jgi:ribosome-binding protein aMBF1 (putative translation factor)
MKATNFDRYLKEQLADPSFASRFRKAGQAWDVALQITALRQRAGLSQKELAQRVKTSQQQICRLEPPAYSQRDAQKGCPARPQRAKRRSVLSAVR